MVDSSRRLTDSIDLSVLDFLPAVVAEINEVSSNETARRRRDLSGRQTTAAPPNPNNIVDTHGPFLLFFPPL